MSQALYRTWRPSSWDEVIGQAPIVATLKNAIASDKVAHAYLFSGPRGTGKTTFARLVAKAVNCLEEDKSKRPCNHCANCLAVNESRFLDLIEIDAASNTSVDDIRDLRDKVNFAPSQGRMKVYIIDEVHMLSTSAFNALLKTLEEPPAHVIFILATTELHKIPATIMSRCQCFNFRRYPVPTIVALLKDLCKKENIKISDDALTLIARQATGAMRDAISSIDQLSSMGKPIDLVMAQELLGTATSQAVIDLVDAMLEDSSAKGLTIIQNTLDSGTDSRQFARQMVDYLRNLLVIKLEGGRTLELTEEQRTAMQAQATRFSVPELTAAIKAFGEAATDLKANWFPGLNLELAFTASVSAGAQIASVTAAVQAPSTAPSAATAPHTNKPAAPDPFRKLKQEPASSFDASQGLTLESVRGQLDFIKKRVNSENVMVGALFNSAEILAVQGNAITLGFKSELLRDKMNDDKNMRILRKALQRVFKQDILINATTSKGFAAGQVKGVIPGGLVEKAQQELGAKVTRVDKKDKEKNNG